MSRACRGRGSRRRSTELIERFKFFLDVASRRGAWPATWLRRLAELRCERKDFRWPIEMRVIQWLRPAQKLS